MRYFYKIYEHRFLILGRYRTYDGQEKMAYFEFDVVFHAVFLVFLTYSNHFYNSFHFDDKHTITDNLSIQNFSRWPEFFSDPRTFSSYAPNLSYRPLVTLSLVIDYALGGGYYPQYFHLSNFFWFLVQIVVMYFLFLRIYTLQGLRDQHLFTVSFFSTCAFSFLTSHAETINYIISRSDLYSTLGVVAGLTLFAYRDSSILRKIPYFYLVPLVLGLLSKPTALMFAPIQIAYMYCIEGERSIANIFKKSLPSLLLVIGLGYFVHYMDPQVSYFSQQAPWWYRLTQPFVLLRYFSLYFLPIGLSADTDMRPFHQWSDLRIYVGVGFLLFMFLFSFYALRKKTTRPLAFGFLWFLLASFPTSWIPLSEVTNDHRMFFPFVGLHISVCWSVYLFFKFCMQHFRKSYVQVFFSIAISLFCILNAYGVYERNKVWFSEESLWLDVTQKSPNNARGLMNFGIALIEDKRYQEAEVLFKRALQLLPSCDLLYTNLGIVYAALHKNEEAEQYFKSAFQYDTQVADVRFFMRIGS